MAPTAQVDGAAPQKRVGIYSRISQDRDDTGLGVERQEEMCRTDAERRGWLVVGEPYRDNNLSGSKKLRRPAYERLMKDLIAGRLDAIIAYDSSRITRDQREWVDLIEHVRDYRFTVGFVTGDTGDITTAYGEMLASILNVIASGESRKMGERVRAAFVQKRATGAWLGGPRPFGWDVVKESDGTDEHGAQRYKAGRLVVNQAEKREVVRACKAVIKGATLNSVAADWNRRGIKTTGKPRPRKDGTTHEHGWTTTQVRNVLLRPKNAGWLDHQGELFVKGDWEPLITEEMWRAVEREVDPIDAQGERLKKTGVGNARKHLLSGLARCGECGEIGAFLKVAGVKDRDGSMRTTYRCSAVQMKDGTARSIKGHPNRTAQPIDEKVQEYTIQRILTSDPETLLHPQDDDEQVALGDEALDVRTRIDDLTDAYRRGRITIKPFTDTISMLQADLDRIEAQRRPSTNALVLEDLIAAGSEEELRRVWFGDPDVEGDEGLPLTRKREVISVLFDIRVFKSKRQGPKFDGASVVITPK